MATQTIQFSFLTGQTVTVKLFADDGSDTVLATPTATESTNRTGVYTFTQTDRAAGNYLITVSATGINAEYSLPLTLDTTTFWAIERSNVTHIAGTAQTARDIGASVLLSNGTGTGQVKLASGYVSPNWGDVANPTTAVGLTGTTISSSQSVASVSGAVGSVAGGVTVTTNNDKTGYSLSQAFPTNFSSLAITGGGAVTAGTVSDKTGYSLTQAFPTNFSSLAISGSGEVTAGTVSDKTGYSLSQAFPTNFSSLAITGGGAVTAGTVSDKTGYSLSQSFPTNFASMAITVGGAVTAGTVSDKTGYSLATAPLDAAGVRAAVGLASANLDTKLDTIDDFLDTEVAAIKAKTDNLPADPADASDIAAAFSTVNTKLDTIDDFLDTEISAMKVVTDKYGTMVVQDGLVYQFTTNALENGPAGGGGGGSSTIAVYPLNATMPARVYDLNLTFYKNEDGTVVGPVSVTSRNANVFEPVDLSGRALSVRFVDYEGTELLTVANGDITVSGADNNQINFPVTSDLTGSVTETPQDQWHIWTLHDLTSGDNVLIGGKARVLLC